MNEEYLNGLLADLMETQKETSKEVKETSKKVNGLLEKLEETIKVIERNNKEVNESIDKVSERINRIAEETSRVVEETSRVVKETSKKLNSVGKQLGNIAKNQGLTTEEFFINSLQNLKVCGITYDELHKNMHKKIKNIEGEFDIVLINGKDIAIIEVKYKAHENDLLNLIEVKHKRFKALYPEYNDYTHHLGLASFHISDEVKNQALENNVFILQRKGKIIESFIPTINIKG